MNKYIEKIKKMPKGLKASIALFLANVVKGGIAYLTTPLFTRLLTAEEYGATSVYLTWVQVLGIVAMFGLANGVFNSGMQDYPNDRDCYSFSILILSNLITVLTFFCVLVIYPLIKSFLGIHEEFLILMFVDFLFQPAYNFWITRQRYEYKYKASAFWAICLAILSPLTAIVCIVKLPQNHLNARIFGGELPLLFVYIGFYIYLLVKGRVRLNIRYWKVAFVFNLPLLPHYLSIYLLNSSDKLMISFMIGDAAAAYYSVAYSIASVGMLVWSAINASLIPFTYEKCRKKDYAAISTVTMPIITFFAFFCFLMMMFAPEVVEIMATKDYMEAIYVIPPVIGGVFFQVQYNMYGNIVFYYKKTRYIMCASITATVLNLVLNYIFISRFGYIAAGYTTLFSYTVQAVLDYVAMAKTTGEHIYDMKYMIYISGGVLCGSLFGNFTYNFMMLRYLFVTVILAICFIKRKKIQKMFESSRTGVMWYADKD